MTRRNRSRGRGGCGCFLTLVLLLFVGLVVAAEFGTRWYIADRAESEISTRLDAPVSVGFGSAPVLLDLATRQEIGEIHVTSPGSATVPRLDVTGYDVRMVDGGFVAATANGVAVLDGQQLVAAAESGNPAEGSPVAGMAEVRSVRPDAASGLLRADIGGIAEVGVAPGVTGGQLTLTPQQTALLGFPLPDGLFSGITATVDSTLASLPEGVTIHEANVTNEGLAVGLRGKDVVLR